MPTLDCDGDAWSPTQGDCDDDDGEVSPSATEVCGDRRDNNCDGFFDEACGAEVHLGTVRGGGGCTQQDQAPGGGTAVAVWWLPLAWFRRRAG